MGFHKLLCTNYIKLFFLTQLRTITDDIPSLIWLNFSTAPFRQKLSKMSCCPVSQCRCRWPCPTENVPRWLDNNIGCLRCFWPQVPPKKPQQKQSFPSWMPHLLIIDGMQTFKDHDLVWLDQLRRILRCQTCASSVFLD